MKLLDKVLRTGEGKKLKALQALVPEINALEPQIEALSDDALRHKTVEFRQRSDNGEPLDDIMLEAFAVVREGASRTIGQRHYDVQLMGGAALHFGWVAEMRTGEGKTLVSTLPVYLNGISGKGVHVITVNDYLATRDAEWMGQVHRWLGLSLGLIVPGRNDAAYKREQYAADVTYGTNNEFGFDYLRDNMAMSRERQVQRGFNFAIVDEVDSILVDEARTPLIISGRVADAADLYYRFAEIVARLERDLDYDVDEEKRITAPTESGIEKVEQQLGIENLYDSVQSNYVHQLGAALRAKELFHRDKDYIIVDGQVKIVDEFTGRVLDGRRWSDGLHQAVEAKEGVKIKEENQTLATVTLQNYFRMYQKLAGMTGTAESDAAELETTYGLQFVPIPTNKPIARDDQGDLIYKTEMAKFDAVITDLEERYSLGQPVLVGTASVEKSELLSMLMQKRGIRHEVLNAKQHNREAEIVAQAGRLHAVTVATNMAGRGVDIILGGNPEIMASRDAKAEGLDPDSDEGQARVDELTQKHLPQTIAEGEEVCELGGLYVLGTERHESRRIDNQLRGRSGRQGDPGESRFYLSLEDDLMRLFATGAMNWVMDRALPDDVPIEAKMVTKAIERAQNTVEQRNAEIRKNVLKYDEVMNEQRKVIYRRRDQILDAQDMREESVDYIADAVDHLIASWCVADYAEDWDLESLANDLASYWPSEQTTDSLAELRTTDEIYERLAGEAMAVYESREGDLGESNMREVERQVMLRIIDQRWREHLYEMDYLKEGINLRAMGQKDPLTEWQREGYAMFTDMMHGIAQDFVKYIMHVQVVKPPEEAKAETQVEDVSYSAPEDPSTRSIADAISGGASSAPVVGEAVKDAPTTVKANETAPAQPVVKSTEEQTPRNAPCPCGSGKKFKHCHGR
ncbi:MAG: preprotein translocase subunit SecA [Actinomycetia bacterium]|nr:preprotein translocase subunit SecA [Actinomycetes bacterium]